MSRRPANSTPGEETHDIQCLYVHYGDDGVMLRRCPNWLPYTVDPESGRPGIYCQQHGGKPLRLSDAEVAWVDRVMGAMSEGRERDD